LESNGAAAHLWAQEDQTPEPKMLYREHRPNAKFVIRGLGLTIAAWRLSARRRRAELDLMAMSPHLKRDLGLLDLDLRGLM
jgi:hypothetical protein